MVADPGRRRLLQWIGAGIGGVLAGCQTLDSTPTSSPTHDPVPTATETPTRRPTDPVTTTLRTTETSASRPLTPDAFDLEVSLLQDFTTEHPARLRITFANTGDRTLVGSDGPKHALPFVADDYVGTDRTDEPRLFLLPDGGPYFQVRLSDDRLVQISSQLPEGSTDECWELSIDWPPEALIRTLALHRIPVRPGERRTHEYTLYHLEDCTTGRISFENSLDVYVGPDAMRAQSEDRFAVTLRFTLSIDADGIRASVGEPTIEQP